MARTKERVIIELGMKVSVVKSGQRRVAVVTQLIGDRVVLRWLTSDLAETEQYEVHRDEVTPLAGWV